MGGFKKKKYIPPDKEVLERLERQRNAVKRLKCSVVFKKDGSMQDYMSTGVFLDDAEFDAYAESYLAALNKVKPGWSIVEKIRLGDIRAGVNIVYDQQENN